MSKTSDKGIVLNMQKYNFFFNYKETICDKSKKCSQTCPDSARCRYWC